MLLLRQSDDQLGRQLSASNAHPVTTTYAVEPLQRIAYRNLPFVQRRRRLRFPRSDIDPSVSLSASLHPVRRTDFVSA